jgi:ABC-type polysaccharide/polyol phosphate export permease
MTAVTQPVATRAHSGVVFVFEPHSSSRPSVREYVGDLWQRRQFIAALARADLRGARSNTFIGELWAVIDPLFQASIYWFLVTVIRGGRGGSSGVELATLIIASVFLFNLTRVALSEGGRSILRSKGLMLNSTFPRAVLPIAALYKGLLEFLPSLGVYAIIHVVTGRPISQGVFLLPLLFLIQVVMSLGMALVFATLTVYVRDTANLLNYVLRLLIFVTPVIYPVSLLTPTMRAVLQWNPLFALFAAYQEIIMGGVPSAGLVFQSVAWATLFLVVGYRMFVANERAFALRL